MIAMIETTTNIHPIATTIAEMFILPKDTQMTATMRMTTARLSLTIKAGKEVAVTLNTRTNLNYAQNSYH